MNGNSRMSIILIVFTFEQKNREERGTHSFHSSIKIGKQCNKKMCVWVVAVARLPQRLN